MQHGHRSVPVRSSAATSSVRGVIDEDDRTAVARERGECLPEAAAVPPDVSVQGLGRLDGHTSLVITPPGVEALVSKVVDPAVMVEGEAVTCGGG